MRLQKQHRHSYSTLATAAAILLATSSLAFAEAELPKPVKTAEDVAQAKRDQGAPTPAAQLQKAPANGEMAFVISDFSPAVYPGWDSCPGGTWAHTLKEAFLATVPPAEKARLVKSENEPELTDKWKATAFGPNNTNVCTNYDKFPDRALQAQVQTKVAYGLKLHDDPKDPYVCSHETFTSPVGEQGIDNQAYRALGCSTFMRGVDGKDGEVIPAFRGQIATGQILMVMLLRGVDSLVNDNDVEVILASSEDRPYADSQQKLIANASFNVSAEPRWRNVLHGRIVDGVLMTDSKDLHLRRQVGTGGARGANADWDVQRAKVRLAFRPDGTLQGVFGGYQTMLSFIQEEVNGGRGTALVAGDDCASKYNTMKKLADGARDPQTGQCTRLSTAYKMAAVPAYVFDRPPQSTTTADASIKEPVTK